MNDQNHDAPPPLTGGDLANAWSSLSGKDRESFRRIAADAERAMLELGPEVPNDFEPDPERGGRTMERPPIEFATDGEGRTYWLVYCRYAKQFWASGAAPTPMGAILQPGVAPPWQRLAMLWTETTYHDPRGLYDIYGWISGTPPTTDEIQAHPDPDPLLLASAYCTSLTIRPDCHAIVQARLTAAISNGRDRATEGPADDDFGTQPHYTGLEYQDPGAGRDSAPAGARGTKPLLDT